MRTAISPRLSLAWLVAQVATSAPLTVSTEEPSIVTKVAMSTGTPINMSPSATVQSLMARQWEWTSPTPAWSKPPMESWASPPAWTPTTQSGVSASFQTIFVTKTPDPTTTPTPTPTYTWEETHDDSANTRAHGIIAAVAIGSILAAGVAGVIITLCVRICCVSSKRKDKSSRDEEEGDVTDCSGSVNSPSLHGQPTQPRRFVEFGEDAGIHGGSLPAPLPMAYSSHG